MALDLLFLATLVYGVYKGTSSGLVGGSMSIFKLLIGIVLALRLGPLVSDFMHRGLGWEGSYIGPIGSFLVVLIGSFFGLKAVGDGLGGVMDKTGLGFVNKYAGSVVWVGALLFLFSTAVNIGTRAGVFPPEVTNRSAVYPYVEPIMPIFKNTFGATAQRYYTEIKSGLGGLLGEAKKGAKEADQQYREEYYRSQGTNTIVREKTIADVSLRSDKSDRRSGYWVYDRGKRTYEEPRYYTQTTWTRDKYKAPKKQKPEKVKDKKKKEKTKKKVKDSKRNTRRIEERYYEAEPADRTIYNKQVQRRNYDPWWSDYRQKYRNGQ